MERFGKHSDVRVNTLTSPWYLFKEVIGGFREMKRDFRKLSGVLGQKLDCSRLLRQFL
eukprot:CAMPEP_0194774794 /NCGR_PEP_ID=MMETSP0323_2-20130528/58545_1 /TAXON_ID=2866 ORGANISM="Crypthecodinium cohnii, Strain Seligo" /NCGR_SAMPLE_ID=MMETSP0323_2 /ASSEMBLY_ACC=CAM_ASM_000346 /LENGTH=57 /DNA_ID=CAMNT_0039710477 /DNA_START=1 /DNA_END=174 /DNA_ORIENTATION=-